MSLTLLPFLYQTRTLRLGFRVPASLNLVRLAHSSRPTRTPPKDNAIPFEWDPEGYNDGIGQDAGQASTITPSEAQIFKGIFDEIAQGRMPQARKRSPTLKDNAYVTDSTSLEGGNENSGLSNRSIARSIVEQARVTEFREKFLRRYPKSLRNAALVALGLYESEPEGSDSGQARIIELVEGDQDNWTERAKYDLARAEELERVEALMRNCNSDEALWKVMEEEVLSLPEKLGIVQAPKNKKPPRGRQKAVLTKLGAIEEDGVGPLKGQISDEATAPLKDSTDDEKRVMNIHGPLYSQFINTALNLFNTAFSRPSPYAFQILPRVKALGLPSYVLGVSTPFYTKLASLYWNHYGDANSALDVLQEMSSAGLYADMEVQQLLSQIHDHLHGCTWGAQGPFAMAMMESPPYDGALAQRLEDMEKTVRQSMHEHSRDDSS